MKNEKFRMKNLKGVLAAIALAAVFSGAAHAAAVTVTASGINGSGGSALPGGKYVQVIQSSSATPGAPDQTTGLPASGTIVTTGTLASPGNFSAGVSVSSGNYVYIRAFETWSGTGTPSGKYGDSVPANVGTGFVYTYTPASFSTTKDVVPVATPTLSGMAPTSGNQGQALTVTLTGSNTTWGGTMTSAVAFSGSGITVNSATATSATIITANITIDPVAATGARTVTVTGASGSATFTVNPGTAPTSVLIDDFEGGSVGTWTAPNPNSGYYTFGDGMMTPNNSNITSQGPDASAAKNGAKGMKVRFSYVANTDLTKDWGDGWGATLIKPVDLSAMKAVTMNIKWDGSTNTLKFGFKDKTGHVYTATVTNSTLTAVSGYGPISIPISSFTEDTANPSRTTGAIDWTGITDYSLAYLNKGTTTNYQYIDDITAVASSGAVTGGTIISVNPAAAPTGTKVVVNLVSGNSFGSYQGNSKLSFTNKTTGATVSSAIILKWSDSSIEAIVPIMAQGNYDVRVNFIPLAGGVLTAYDSTPTPFQVTSTGAADIAAIWPNPFNAGKESINIAVADTKGATNIGFYIFDMTARLAYKYVAVSTNQISWNGYDMNSSIVGDGAYIVRVINEDTKSLLAKGKILVIKH